MATGEGKGQRQQRDSVNTKKKSTFIIKTFILSLSIYNRHITGVKSLHHNYVAHPISVNS
jgi:hypothetical protein